jgi:hypothetical protein
LGPFIKHLVGAPKIKGLETLFKQAQPPATIAHNQHQNNGAQSKSGIVPKISKKNEKKNGGFGKNGVSGFFVGKVGKMRKWAAGGGW